ncbi:hypothetical protein HK098_006089 [Nowakowskiella sp. JEL0407]|nr:hypothetical protein HK098_006089 [Nowakowskiella sp. JEL0407]
MLKFVLTADEVKSGFVQHDSDEYSEIRSHWSDEDLVDLLANVETVCRKIGKKKDSETDKKATDTDLQKGMIIDDVVDSNDHVKLLTVDDVVEGKDEVKPLIVKKLSNDESVILQTSIIPYGGVLGALTHVSKNLPEDTSKLIQLVFDDLINEGANKAIYHRYVYDLIETYNKKTGSEKKLQKIRQILEEET